VVAAKSLTEQARRLAAEEEKLRQEQAELAAREKAQKDAAEHLRRAKKALRITILGTYAYDAGLHTLPDDVVSKVFARVAEVATDPQTLSHFLHGRGTPMVRDA
jgi:hypothetical protein